MSSLGALALGLALGVVFLHLMRPVLASPHLERLNHRGHRLPTSGGLPAVVAAIVGIGAWWWTHADGPVYVMMATLLAVVGFGFLGFVDDVLAAGADRGFTGHLRALLHGRLTTGGLKLLGGAGIGVLAGLAVEAERPWRVAFDAALVALAANTGNLFDRAPGRTLKVGSVAAAVIVAVAPHRLLLAAPLVAIGAFVALLPADLHESLMLGDTGANALGGVLGVAVLVSVRFPVRMGILLVLLVLNAASEVVSFSSVIDRVAPLRWVDRAGRSPGYPEVP